MLKPGTKLPTIRALASELSCSVITTQRAYRDLEDEGLILTRQGRGTVVAQIPEEKMSASRREAVEAAFGEAVRTGRRAGLTEEELRDVLDETLQRDHTNVQRGHLMTDKRPVISLRDVRKSYGAFELGPIDLDIQRGYVVAIVGPNGGGKSTLMGMLMNLIQPTSGEISLFGGAYPEDEVAIKRRIGYAPERPSATTI